MVTSIVCLLLLSGVLAQDGELWREDGLCGVKNPLADGAPAQCNPEGDGPRQGPCCSSRGFCGNTPKHCKCTGCKDFTKVKGVEKKSQNESSSKKTQSPAEKPKEKTSLQLNKGPIDEKISNGKKEHVELTVSQGHLRGTKSSTDSGFTLYEFKGIPFAQPPIGRLRFKSPVPAKKWKGTFEATEYGSKCYQYHTFQEQLVGSEDCLYLNIFTKRISQEDAGLPVMVWIHGGGLTQGAGSEYNPSKLVKEDVVVVTMNYRLGGVGFLTFGNEKVSGNMGVRDQAEAIQWVKRNIAHFGGDANKITIFGESAGGTSVHAQVLSPKNAGQLAGAIAQSGTMGLYGIINSKNIMEKQLAVDIARIFNCSEELDQSTLFCLQQVDGEEIGKAMILNPDQQAKYGGWHIVVDDYTSDPFMPYGPLVAMKSGMFNQIPFISGTVKNDGSFLKNIVYNESSDSMNDLAKILFIQPRAEKPKLENSLLASIIRQYYREKENGLADMFTDGFFVGPDQVTVKSMSKYNPMVFNYHFTQKTNNSLLAPLFNLTYEETPVHGDELPFLMDINFPGYTQNFSEEEKRTEEIMIKFWTNFAKFGHPTPSSGDLPHWRPVNHDSEAMEYMELSSSPVMKDSLYPERMLLWNKLVSGPREQEIDNKIVYSKATEFLLQQLSEKGQSTHVIQ